MAAEIVIVDYGMGNLRSVQKAFEQVGSAAEITRDPERILNATKLVLPGVGAYRDAIEALRSSGLSQAILEHIDEGLPFLGICLGLQLLFTRSHEDGLYPGLDLFPGDVVRFPGDAGVKVPHMGWNTVTFTQPNCPLVKGLPENPAFYFVHGYYAEPLESDLILGTADYPNPFCAAIWRDNVFATQFHPEKSQRVGLALLKNFADL
jgi:glutamine amidotransferase